jgi:hypothetical protein
MASGEKTDFAGRVKAAVFDAAVSSAFSAAQAESEGLLGSGGGGSGGGSGGSGADGSVSSSGNSGNGRVDEKHKATGSDEFGDGFGLTASEEVAVRWMRSVFVLALYQGVWTCLCVWVATYDREVRRFMNAAHHFAILQGVILTPIDFVVVAAIMVFRYSKALNM